MKTLSTQTGEQLPTILMGGTADGSDEHQEPIPALLGAIRNELTLIREELSQHPPAGHRTPKALLSLEQVAGMLSVCPRTVEALVASGDLVPLRIRGVRRFTVESVEAYVRAQVNPRAGRHSRRKAA